MWTFCVGKEIRKNNTQVTWLQGVGCPYRGLGESKNEEINVTIGHFIAMSLKKWRPYSSRADYKPRKYTQYISNRKVSANLEDLLWAPELSLASQQSVCGKGRQREGQRSFYFRPREDTRVYEVWVCAYAGFPFVQFLPEILSQREWGGRWRLCLKSTTKETKGRVSDISLKEIQLTKSRLLKYWPKKGA